jgi:hypothetical protein
MNPGQSLLGRAASRAAAKLEAAVTVSGNIIIPYSATGWTVSLIARHLQL